MANFTQVYCIYIYCLYQGYLQLSLMGIQFEKLKKNLIIIAYILVTQGRVRGNKNIFKVGLNKTYAYHDLRFWIAMVSTIYCSCVMSGKFE